MNAYACEVILNQWPFQVLLRIHTHHLAHTLRGPWSLNGCECELVGCFPTQSTLEDPGPKVLEPGTVCRAKNLHGPNGPNWLDGPFQIPATRRTYPKRVKLVEPAASQKSFLCAIWVGACGNPGAAAGQLFARGGLYEARLAALRIGRILGRHSMGEVSAVRTSHASKEVSFTGVAIARLSRLRVP